MHLIYKIVLIKFQTALGFLPFTNGGIVDWWESTEDGHLKQIRREDNPDAFKQHNNHQYEARINQILSKYQDGKSSDPFFMFLAMQLPHTPFTGDNVERKFRDLYANGSAFLDEERYQHLATYDKDSTNAKDNHIGVRKIAIKIFEIF